MVKNVLNTLRKKQKNNKGFSLVELIVVIAIMAVLVGVLAPQLIRYVEKSRESTDIQNCDSIATTLKSYFADKENVKGKCIVTVTDAATATSNKKDATTAALGTNASGFTADEVNAALTNAGLNSTALKGNGWDPKSITITYDTENGQVTYNASSDHYLADNSAKIEKKIETKKNNE